MKILAYQCYSQGILRKSELQINITKKFNTLKSVFEKEHSNLVVLPELSTIEYSVKAFRNLNELAEPLYGQTFEKASKLATEISAYISYGFPRIDKGNIFISQVIIDDKGHYVNHYDKIHLAQIGSSPEKMYFKAGDKPTIINIKGINIGFIICYDFRFPEFVSGLVNKYNIDLIIHPVAFTKDATFDSWHHFAITRALENQVYFLSVNRAGKEWGCSIFCPPWIDNKEQPTILGKDESINIFEISKSHLAHVRKLYPLRHDKLKDYNSLFAND